MTTTMTPIEALATALCIRADDAPCRGPIDHMDTAADTLRRIPPGFALVSVEEVARRRWDELRAELPPEADMPSWDRAEPADRESYLALARRVLGLEPDR